MKSKVPSITLSYGLKFESTNSGNIDLFRYADADWAGDLVGKRSTFTLEVLLFHGDLNDNL